MLYYLVIIVVACQEAKFAVILFRGDHVIASLRINQSRQLLERFYILGNHVFHSNKLDISFGSLHEHVHSCNTY